MSGKAGLLARLAPPGCAAAEIRDCGQPVALRAGEVLHVEGASAKRQRDFALGRDCAHRALAQLGAVPETLARDARGAPLWPRGIVGSITHTEGYAAAAVARQGLFCRLGIDAERVGRVTPDIAARLFTPRETAAMAGLDGAAWRRAATIRFSAKEACYKTLQGAAKLPAFRALPIALTGDGFTLDEEWGEAPPRLTGRFLVEKDLVVTLAVVAAS